MTRADASAAPPPEVEIDLLVEAGDWPPEEELSALADRAVAETMAEVGASGASTELSVVFTDDAHIRTLNAQWRGKDKATNVLSFPAFQGAGGSRLPPMLGDIVLASGTVAHEAALEGKPIEHHITHLVVHGLLHLLGHDHETEPEAEAMEALERSILARPAIPDPYALTEYPNDRTMMNETPETAARPDAGSATKPSEAGEDGSSPSTAAAPAAERPGFFERLSGLFRHRNGNNLRDDLTDALAESETGAESFSPAERAMLNNILRLREVRVEDVMVPRADIEALDISTKLGDLMTVFEQSGHSRMPVYSETLDDPRGMVHIRDVLAHITRSARAKKGRATRKPAPGVAPLDLANVDLGRSIGELNLMRTVLFVPPSMLASDLMGRMQASRTQMALVIDEYGGTDGLVSLEDIVEMVVGDIEDEHDEDVPLITQAGEGIFVVDAKAEIDDVAKMIGEEFAPGEHAEYVDTIGGLIFNAPGRVPAREEVVQAIPGFEFHVLDADPRRVKRVRIVETKGERRRRAAAAKVEQA